VLFYSDDATDPATNLRREAEIFEDVDAGRLPEVVRLWVNSRCLVRGPAKARGYGWYDEKLADEMKIPVITRATGGGVVYQDEGNLNWSFFFRNSGRLLAPPAAFELGSRSIIDALNSLGVGARFSPPNRIDVSGRKVSGLAARSTPRTLLVHGTLLLNADLQALNRLCIPPSGCPPVANIGISADALKDALVSSLAKSGWKVKAAGARTA